jgi:hypothetical protein
VQLVPAAFRNYPSSPRKLAAERQAKEKGEPVSRLGLVVALALCFAAGYLLAGLWSSGRDTTPLAQICARVDYVNSLQENLKGPDAASEDVRGELKRLVEQCRAALRDRAEEND